MSRSSDEEAARAKAEADARAKAEADAARSKAAPAARSAGVRANSDNPEDKPPEAPPLGDVGSKPVDPTLSPQDAATSQLVTGATATGTSGEDTREKWGDTRPTLADLDKATAIRVRTKDPRLANHYVAGLLVTPAERTIPIDTIKALGKTHLASFVSDPGIEVRVEGESAKS